MAVTVTLDTPREQRVSRDLRLLTGTVTFDSSYPAGGESCTDITKYFGGGEFLVIFEGKGGYSFEWDKTNNKVKAFVNAPPLVFEELIVAGADVDIPLNWPAAHIDYVATEAAPMIPIAGDETPVTTTVACDVGYNDTTGVLTYGEVPLLNFFAADGTDTTYCTYATQAWRELTDNMVQARFTAGARTYGHADAAMTAGTPDRWQLGEDMVAVQAITFNDGTVEPPEVLKDGGAPAATMETEIDFTKATDLGEINTYATDAYDAAGATVTVTYIRDPGAGYFISDRFTNAEIVDA